MDGSYDLTMGSQTVGHVHVEKQGLYYHFSCRCKLGGDVMHKLVVHCGGREENLGVCIPMDGMFGVEKKIPAKRLGQGTPQFQLLPKHEEKKGKFVPVYPEEPFSYLSKLENAFLETRNGQIGVVIADK